MGLPSGSSITKLAAELPLEISLAGAGAEADAGDRLTILGEPRQIQDLKHRYGGG